MLRDERGGLEISSGRRQVGRTAHTVYVTGCASKLDGAFAGHSASHRRRGCGLRRRRRRRDRLRDRRPPPRPRRAFVKIQDRCSFSCAFCVIPLVRGGTRSRPAGAVLAEVRRRVAHGHREIVLTGVNLGCFRDRAAGHTRAAREGGGRDARPGAAAAFVDRGQPRRSGAWRGDHGDTARSRRTSTSLCSRATTRCSERWAAATRPGSSSAGWRRSATSA